MKAPLQVFDFTGYAASNPSQPLPGDRVDAQFADHAEAITSAQDAIDDIRRTDGALKNEIVTEDSLAPGLVATLTAAIAANVAADAAAASGYAATATTAKNDAITAKNLAIDAKNEAVAAKDVITGGAASALAQIALAQGAAEAAETSAYALASDISNDANNAAGAAEEANEYAIVANAWAEYMPGPIPPNILAVMGISGEHWSSRWWANQSDLHAQRAEDAAEALTTLGGYYLGAYTSPPTEDPLLGNPVITGSVYYDLTLNVLRVWNGTAWRTITIDYAEAASPVATNIQIDTTGWVFDGVTTTFSLRDMGAIPVTPAYSSACIVSLDGVVQGPETYSISSDTIIFDNPPPADTTAWMIAGLSMSVTSADTVPWTGVTGKPSTFAPSAHTHTLSEITDLSSLVIDCGEI